MRFVTITIFAVTGTGLVALAIAKPIPNWKAGAIAIPLTKHPSSLTHSNESIDLDTITSHAILVGEKIHRGLDNYEMNTGTMHPLAVKRSESRLAKRGASLPLTPTSRGNGWMAEISIGTPPKTFKVHIDTGSADMWVLEVDCEGIQSEGRDLWDFHLSDTSAFEGQPPFRLQYKDGTTVKGDLYSDNVTIAGFTADPQTFGVVSSYSGPIRNDVNSDGLLGLAFPSISEFNVDPLFDSLVSQHAGIDPRFSLKFAPSGAEMYVGGVNSMLYNGDIVYTPVRNPGFWEVSMDDVRVNGNKVLENVPAIFDTGSGLIFGDWERVKELYKSVGGILVERNNFGFYTLPCTGNSFPRVNFTFNRATFEIRREALILVPVTPGHCMSAIVAHRFATEHWIIGMAFLQDVYTVFDYSALQVGFAKLA